MLTSSDHAFLHDALKQAQQKTSAKISLVVRPASASYHDYALIFGIVFGSIAAIALWASGLVRGFPSLIGIQLGIVAICDLAHGFGGFFAHVAPKQARHRLAAEAAHREYHRLHAHLPSGEPFVLLFVSLAEQYVHVLTNPVVHERIPGDWHKVTENFTLLVRIKNLRDTCAEAINRIADILSAPFPKQ